MSDDIIAAGGWCAPSESIYQLAEPITTIDLPVMSVQQGLQFKWDILTDAQRIEREVVADSVRRMVQKFMDARHAAINAACATGLENGWEVHIWEPPDLMQHLYGLVDNSLVVYQRSVGIEFRETDYPVPTLHFHQCPRDWDLMDDDEWGYQ